MNVSIKNDSRTKQNVVFVKQPGWRFQFRFESFSSGFGRGCIIAIVSLIISENQSGQFGTWFVIIHLITYWFLNWGEPSINQPTSEKRASMKLIKDCEHSQPPTSATANQLCCVDCSTWIITLHWCNLEKTPRVYLIRWPWHAFQNIWTPSVSVCVCLSPRNRLNPLVLMKLPMVMSHSFSMFFDVFYNHPVARLLSIFDHAAQTILQLNLPTSSIHLGAGCGKTWTCAQKIIKKMLIQMGQKHFKALCVHAPCVLRQKRDSKMACQLDHEVLVAEIVVVFIHNIIQFTKQILPQVNLATPSTPLRLSPSHLGWTVAWSPLIDDSLDISPVYPYRILLTGYLAGDMATFR